MPITNMYSLFMNEVKWLLLKENKYLIKGISTNNFFTNPLSLMDNIEYQPKSNEKYITFYISFQVLKVLPIQICKIQSLYLWFLNVFVSFYISIYNFSQILSTSFNINWKKDFRHKFCFLTDSLLPLCPTPLLFNIH